MQCYFLAHCRFIFDTIKSEKCVNTRQQPLKFFYKLFRFVDAILLCSIYTSLKHRRNYLNSVMRNYFVSTAKLKRKKNEKIILVFHLVSTFSIKKTCKKEKSRRTVKYKDLTRQ